MSDTIEARNVYINAQDLEPEFTGPTWFDAHSCRTVALPDYVTFVKDSLHEIKQSLVTLQHNIDQTNEELEIRQWEYQYMVRLMLEKYSDDLLKVMILEDKHKPFTTICVEILKARCEEEIKK